MIRVSAYSIQRIGSSPKLIAWLLDDVPDDEWDVCTLAKKQNSQGANISLSMKRQHRKWLVNARDGWNEGKLFKNCVWVCIVCILSVRGKQTEKCEVSVRQTLWFYDAMRLKYMRTCGAHKIRTNSRIADWVFIMRLIIIIFRSCHQQHASLLSVDVDSVNFL